MKNQKKQTSLLILLCFLPLLCNGQDESVKKRLESQYYHVHYYKDCDQYEVSDRNWKKGICDATGKVIFPPKYDDVYILRNANGRMYRVSLNGKKGICNSSGKEIIPPTKYTEIHYQDNQNLFHVKVGDYKGICAINGKEIIPPMYTDIVYQDDGKYYLQVLIGKPMFVLQKGDKIGFCDMEGFVYVKPEKYTAIYQDEDGSFHVRNGEYAGYCDNNWKELLAPQRYTNVYADKEDNKLVGFRVKNGDKHGYCDDNGIEIVPPVYYGYGVGKWKLEGTIRYYVETQEKKHGLLDEKGTVFVEPIYDSLYIPSESLCPAKKEGKWGFISFVDGSIVVPIEYDQVSSFQDGVAKVTKNGKVSMIPNPLKVVAQNSNQPKVRGKSVSTYPAADSEVDNNIPSGKKADANTHAFIIANENYPIAKVPYALNDGWTFEKYCKKALGIKDENVHLFEDATGGNILACVEQMKQVAKAANGNATFIFYYAGHAFPDEEKSTAYLLPVDGDSKNPATGYSLEKLYQELNSVQTKQVICFLDACFSGATRDDQMLIAGRGVAIKVKDEIPQGNMVVMTSATGAETAHSYEEMHHGLFTYYLLEKLQQTKGDVSLGDLSEHVTKMVKRKSVLINQKKQTPTVIPSPKLQSTWQEIKL